MAGKLITQVFGELQGGLFVKQASAELNELVDRVRETGKKGSISVTIEITPSGKENRIMTVKPKLTVKKPPAPETDNASVFFAVRGDLVRDDPEQRQLPHVRSADADGEAPAPSASDGKPRAFG